MNFKIVLRILLIFITLLSNCLCYGSMSDLILKKYKANLYQLPLVKQEHFAVRMYRITGSTKYINPVIAYIYFLSFEYRSLVSKFNHPDRTLRMALHLLRDNVKPTEKYQLRAKKIAQYGDLYFYLSLLELMNKVFSYNLENTPLFPHTDVVLDELRSQSTRLRAFILDETNIKIDAAQLINYVYYLNDLGILDLRESYTRQFQHTFPDDIDRQLTKLDYEAKIYGMTHFITAASHYYQNTLDEKSFRWISDYFERNIEQILRRTENDVIAEVGVCLMVLNKQDSPAVEKIKQYLEKKYNHESHMIPTLSNSLDFVDGEHRNILTVMLFKWPKKLKPGPNFTEKLSLAI